MTSFDEQLDEVFPGMSEADKDKMRLARMEAQESAHGLAVAAKEKDFVLGVKHGDDYFLNTRMIDSMVISVTPVVITNQATQEDFKRVIVGMADSAAGAKVYADGIDTIA